MKKCFFNVVLTLTSLVGLGTSARAQEDASRVTVTVPFEFVAGGQIMPAGTYSVGRVFADSGSGLMIRGHDNTAILLPMFVEEASAQRFGFSFEHVADKHFLSKIETRAGVYTITASRAITNPAPIKDLGTVSSAGAN